MKENSGFCNKEYSIVRKTGQEACYKRADGKQFCACNKFAFDEH